MLVGSTSYDIDFLRSNYKDPIRIKKYSDSLVPEELRHNEQLKMNQLYFICLTMRRIGILDYENLYKTIESLFYGLRVSGIGNSFHSVKELNDFIDKDRILLYLERFD